ncbi:MULTISPECIES: hypothetical protein [unclassified Aeromicrobium]|uniref:hypothetical protein n=1 Tax=unclassified Aeromicrobium TaxID=2633570 RepID=UPI00396AF8E3
MARRWIAAVAAVAAVALAAGVGIAVAADVEDVAGEPFTPAEASEADVRALESTKVFFAHQSVGDDVLRGLALVHDREGLPQPAVAEATSVAGPGVTHMHVGTNGDPMGKIEEFDSVVRSGVGDEADVVVFKLCYVDLWATTDHEKVFAAYRDTLRSLQEAYPDTAFVATTEPLTTRRSWKGWVKKAIGRDDGLANQHNIAREQYNQLVRAEFTEPGELWDIAAMQSTTPSGDRVAAVEDGQTFYSLYDGYARDPGHLNEEGSVVAAESFLAAVSAATAR